MSLLDADPAAATFDEARMTPRQVLVILGAVALAMADGFDALSMAFTAPVVGHAWRLGKVEVGLLLSSGLAGMALGSIFLSPLADRVGRRPMVLAGLSLMTLGSLLSVWSHSAGVLAATRILTGLGIGVLVTLTTSLAAEFSSARSRPFAVASTTVGFALGGAVGGIAAAALLRSAGWQSVFLTGAIVSGVLLAIFSVAMPESPVFLSSLGTPKALARLDRTLAALGRSSGLIVTRRLDISRRRFADLFRAGAWRLTLRLAAVLILLSTPAYYLISWLPQFVTELGFSPSMGGLVSATSGLLGIVGALLLGAAANRVGPARVAGAAMVGFAVFLVALGFAPRNLAVLLLISGGCGFFLSSATGVFYSTLAVSLPPLLRASGIGFVMGLGRIVSAFGPALAGQLFASGFPRTDVSLIFAVLPLFAAALVLRVPELARRINGD